MYRSLYIQFTYQHKVDKVIIATYFKAEGPYLQEWTSYHLALGFDRIYLFDTNDGDDDLDFIRNITDSRVIFISERGQVQKFTVDIQSRKVTQFYHEYLGPKQWCAFIDLDEFVVLTPPFTPQRLVAVAERKCQANQLQLNLETYGNNGHRTQTEGGVLERFPLRTQCPNDDCLVWTKTFIKGGIKGISSKIHVWKGPNLRTCNALFKPWDNQFFVRPPIFTNAYIKHFTTKSEEEWRTRKVGKKYSWNPMYGWEAYDHTNQYPPNVPHIHDQTIED